jgi:glycosyltransferase involved in cell wall biosynthesis
MKIAIVHDFLNQYGGAEKVVEVLNELFPEAPIYTIIYDKDIMPANFRNMDIRTSYMQKIPGINRHFKKFLLFYPRAVESFNLKEYDLVISSSSSFAKGAVTNQNICHICYCYTPMRFVWDYKHYIEKENFNKIVLKMLPSVMKRLKKWDIKSSGRVNYFIGISNHIKERIRRSYDREAVVIYPPVEVKEFNVSDSHDDYFLIVSRLNAYKNIDLVIKAFNVLDLKLKIVGTGPYRSVLENINKSKNIEFLGRLSNVDIKEIYTKCRAYIFPGTEDFGISPVEAQASGRPVIAYAAGGALETVIGGVTGLFFSENTVESFIKVINNFIVMEDNFNPTTIRENALRFDQDVFKNRMKDFIFKKHEEFLIRNYG